jgi:hypothetical protein
MVLQRLEVIACKRSFTVTKAVALDDIGLTIKAQGRSPTRILRKDEGGIVAEAFRIFEFRWGARGGILPRCPRISKRRFGTRSLWWIAM